eukprot:3559387-Pleurochrysis_carterae.AAC.2
MSTLETQTSLQHSPPGSMSTALESDRYKSAARIAAIQYHVSAFDCGSWLQYQRCLARDRTADADTR